MLLRDPVHGLVAFEGRAERVIEALLATREVQRLRRVKQLGLTSLVFPGAEHTRFAHALGAAHVMQRLQLRIVAAQDDLPMDARLDEAAADEALAAALLHDLGHGPFSHLYEEVSPHARHHEDWTRDVLLDDGTDVHRALEGLSSGMATRVAGMLRGEHRLGYLARAISGTIDVDRADYLLRDSYMTGVRYGLYDLDWVLRSLAFGQVGGEWVLAVEGRKGLPPIEGFFLARQHMYAQVYHHKATRAAEGLIRGVFIRVGELVREGRAPAGTPAALRAAALGERVSLGDYLALDDIALLGALSGWEQAEDQALSLLARRLRARDLPKTLPLPSECEPMFGELLARTYALAARHGLRPELHVFLDHTSDVPYAEPDDDSPGGLWLLLRHREIMRLGEASFLLKELRNKRLTSSRLIFPRALRDDVETELGPLLGSAEGHR
ncbi:MAG: HD domain-containing protein [Polyangiales bacterium]|nr:HD domain-containing protein [Myxococcales bacterium]MCB9661449.1 HD domain-containing protein [Sandaracinaceae bacterium]